jgi:tRNA synthetases class II (D, K and N)
MFRALDYGAPPHGGLAPGTYRIVMLIANQPNLREVTAFPLNPKAQELLLGAPSPVYEKQLKELHIQLSLAARERLREEWEHPGSAATADHAGYSGVASPAAPVEGLQSRRPASGYLRGPPARPLRLEPRSRGQLHAVRDPRLSSSPNLDLSQH